jgi:hypothetical protein
MLDIKRNKFGRKLLKSVSFSSLLNERSTQVDACPSKRCSFQVKTRIANAVIMNKVVHVIDSALCICVLAFHFLCRWLFNQSVDRFVNE